MHNRRSHVEQQRCSAANKKEMAHTHTHTHTHAHARTRSDGSHSANTSTPAAHPSTDATRAWRGRTTRWTNLEVQHASPKLVPSSKPARRASVAYRQALRETASAQGGAHVSDSERSVTGAVGVRYHLLKSGRCYPGTDRWGRFVGTTAMSSASKQR